MLCICVNMFKPELNNLCTCRSKQLWNAGNLMALSDSTSSSKLYRHTSLPMLEHQPSYSLCRDMLGQIHQETARTQTNHIFMVYWLLLPACSSFHSPLWDQSLLCPNWDTHNSERWCLIRRLLPCSESTHCISVLLLIVDCPWSLWWNCWCEENHWQIGNRHGNPGSLTKVNGRSVQVSVGLWRLWLESVTYWLMLEDGEWGG